MDFKDRTDAGFKLAQALLHYRGKPDAIVLGLLRGGVAVAAEVARCLQLPLNGVLVRKIGAPGNPELALGAIAESGDEVVNEELIAYLGISRSALQKIIEEERVVLQKRQALYWKGTKAPDLMGKMVILVDDGIATGASMHAAVNSVRAQGSSRIVLAAPVASPEAVRRISPFVDETVVLYTPPSFEAVGEYYLSFGQLTDEEVMAYLNTHSSQE